MADQYLTTRAAAAFLGVGTTSVKRWADEGVLECERTRGGHRRFRRAELERFKRGQTIVDGRERLLSDASRAELDELEFGVVRLDDHGRVVEYNQAESQLSGLARSAVVGRVFFTDVAPCTNNRLLRERFRQGVTQGAFDFELDYTFTYRMAPTPVRLRFYREAATGTNWLVVRSLPLVP